MQRMVYFKDVLEFCKTTTRMWGTLVIIVAIVLI